MEQEARQRPEKILPFTPGKDGKKMEEDIKKKKERKRERKKAVSSLLQTLFLALQADAEADGGELTEDGRRRNERPKIGPWRKGI